MILGQASSQSFVLLRTVVWVERARRLLERSSVAYVIVRHDDPKQADDPKRAYYLLTREEATRRLAGLDGRKTLFEALGLEKEKPAGLCDAHTEETAAPARCIVSERGYPMGVYDRAARRTVTRGGPEPEPKPLMLVAGFPEKVSVGQRAPLRVWLTANPGAGKGLRPGARVDVVVKAGGGLKLEVSGKASVFVPDVPRSTPVLEFGLRAEAEGPGHVEVLAMHEGQPVSSSELRPPVEAARDGEEAETLRWSEPLEPVEVRSPDLSLLVLENKVGTETHLNLFLTAANSTLRLNLTRYGPVVLRVNALQYFKSHFADVEAMTPGPDIRKRLQGKGITLFEELLPKELREKLWKYRKRIRTVQVQSEEAWIPWELCRLARRGEEKEEEDDGPAGGEPFSPAEEDLFFCERFALTRWIPGVPARPKLRAGRMALVAPTDSGLASVEKECEAVVNLPSNPWEVARLKSPTYLGVCEEMEKGIYQSWHFTGHGNAGKDDPNRASIVLEGKQPLRPEDISGVNTKLGLACPLVFLNACRVAQAGLSLTGVGGWASQFLRAGAAAFVGTWWAVHDESAAAFAPAFYGELAKGTPIGEAARRARLSISKPDGNATWLAYTVYAHPLATVRDE